MEKRSWLNDYERKMNYATTQECLKSVYLQLEEIRIFFHSKREALDNLLGRSPYSRFSSWKQARDFGVEGLGVEELLARFEQKLNGLAHLIGEYGGSVARFIEAQHLASKAYLAVVETKNELRRAHAAYSNAEKDFESSHTPEATARANLAMVLALTTSTNASKTLDVDNGIHEASVTALQWAVGQRHDAKKSVEEALIENNIMIGQINEGMARVLHGL